jgi:hypothetical protein
MSQISDEWSKKLMRDVWKVTLIQLVTHPITGFRSLRFCLGMWIGGFSSATRKLTWRELSRQRREAAYGSAELWDREYAEMERRHRRAVRPGDEP